MSAVDDCFSELRRAGRKALMPFVTAGDPDLEFTAEVIEEVIRQGGNLCEVGIPYSDPIADGPVIQSSYTRALANRVTLSGTFSMLGRVIPKVSAPLVTMVSYAIVYRHGAQAYVEEAKALGLAGAIIPDLPVEESLDLSAICRQRDFSLIQLVTPTTGRERALRIAEASTGFIYYVSVTGITGERTELPADLVDSVGWLRERTELPICIGFGISTPEHVRQLAPVADGLIVGSAIMRRVAQASQRPKAEVLAEIGQYVRSLADALPGKV